MSAAMLSGAVVEHGERMCRYDIYSFHVVVIVDIPIISVTV